MYKPICKGNFKRKIHTDIHTYTQVLDSKQGTVLKRRGSKCRYHNRNGTWKGPEKKKKLKVLWKLKRIPCDPEEEMTSR